jgi:PAS domain S-box-containing protein
VRTLPELFDLRVKARSLAYLFAAGATLGLLTLALPHDKWVKEPQLIVLAVMALGLAAVLFAVAGQVREWQIHAVLVSGVITATFANYWVGESRLYTLFYTWAALYAFYFFTLRTALVHVAIIGVAYAVLLVIQDPMSPVVSWLIAVGTPVVIGVLISMLRARARSEAETGEKRRRSQRQTESRTRLVLDTSPDAFVTVDRDGIIVFWNVAAEELFGWSASEAIGKPMRSLIVPPEFRERTDSRRRALIAGEGPVATAIFDVEYLRRDGGRFPGEATVSKVVVGDEVLISGFIRDVTERRRRQQEREQLLMAQAAQEEAEKVAEMVRGMQVLVDAALAHRTMDDIVSDLVPRIRAVLEADAATIFLTDESDSDRLRLGASSLGTTRDEVEPFPFGDGFAGRVASTREATLMRGPDPGDLRDPGMRSLEIDSLIGVPLLADNAVIGVLIVCASPPRHFSEDDMSLLRLAADRVALAIAHARVYEREHRIAETLQRSLLPESLPQLPGLEVAARYRPAATEAEVGGDWYDVIPIPGGAAGLVMGDVAGKGLDAASMVGGLRSALRAYALEGHEPAKVVDQLNRLLWTEAEDSQMATLLYLVVDPGQSVARWVNAGHPPPLLLPGDGEPRYLEGSSSVPLGVLPFPGYRELSAELRPGGTILLYTDGLVERPGSHIADGLGRLASLVQGAPRDPEALLDHLLATLVPTAGTPDDVALLALHNIPMADSFSVELPATPETLASMRALLRRWLTHVHSSDQEIAEITTACGEAANNAIEHSGADGGAPFEVCGRLRDREVEITVRDFGAWREPPQEGDQGRGLSLIRALMDSVDVEATPEGTTVRLWRTLHEVGDTEVPGD